MTGSLAQTFEAISGGPEFIVDNNHFKSKGGTPTGPEGPCSVGANTDSGDGQSGFNCTRTQQSKELTAWLATDPTKTGAKKTLIIGDLNSYAKEDPVTTIEKAGYTSLVPKFAGKTIPTSFQFAGQGGTLDYAFGNSAINPLITGAAIWHVNTDESGVLSFGTSFKSQNQVDSLFAPDPFRSSDHDFLVVGLNAVPEPSTILGCFLGFGLLNVAKAKRKGFFKTNSSKK